MKHQLIFSNCRGIAFDFDGTLVDTMGCFADIAADVMVKHHGINFDSARQQYLDTSGIPFHEQLEVIAPGHRLNAKAADEFETRKLEGFFKERIAETDLAVLRRLRDFGFQLFISSNNFQHLISRFVARQGEEIFDLALGYEENFAKGKPHFERIYRDFDIDASELIFVGDSLMDAERALDNNVRFVGRLGTFDHDDFQTHFPGVATISSLQQLEALVGVQYRRVPSTRRQRLTSSVAANL